MSANSIPSSWANAAPVIAPAEATIAPQRYFARSRRVLYVLAAVWVLNVFDLQYTLIESPHQHFVEMNPVAARLLDRPPVFLVTYKTALVLVGSVILLKLRRYGAAEVGCWCVLAAYAMVALCWQQYYIHAMETFGDPAPCVMSLATATTH